MLLRIVAGLSLVCFLGTSCATLVKGPRQDVGLSSSPVGVRALVDGEAYTTPCVVRLKRNESHTIVFEKQGCESTSATVCSHGTIGWLIGNVFFVIGAPIGLVVDLTSGSAFNLEPDTVHAALRPLGKDL